MYKLSVPLNAFLVNEESGPKYVGEFRKAGVERVFLFSSEPITHVNCLLYKDPGRLEKAIAFFQKEGFEVGVWMDAFGHGGVLAHSTMSDYVKDFTRIRGADGRFAQEGFCPLDENFKSVYMSAIKQVANMGPDLIMLDDDFRMNIRQYHMGCCCDRHIKILCDRLGEEIPYEKMEELAFTGGENRYRTEWMKLMGETLLDFAHLLRKTIDEVDENIRLGVCAVYTTWDFDGTDMIALAKAFAGKTRPFIRTIGAPYHGPRVQYAVEHTRMQAAWCDGEDIELFAEGDVYPRPRYAVPSRFLEIFDFAILASQTMEGRLKYMFDYNQNVDYERGYNERHVRNAPLREELSKIFQGKNHVGLRVYEVMHKIEKTEFPIEYVPGVSASAWNTYFSIAQKLASENAIPTVYSSSPEYPTIVFGENARHIQREDMKNGAILDAVAARILSERGFDTGMYSSEFVSFSGEYFKVESEEIRGISDIATCKAEISPNALIDSIYMPTGAPASYFYENKVGQRYFVLLIDAYRSNKNSFNYFNNYYRQSQMLRAIDMLCGHPLPAVCKKQPYLYMQTAKSENGDALSVALFNMNVDEIISPCIILDRAYSRVKCVGCEGYLEGNILHLKNDIASYGMAAVELFV